MGSSFFEFNIATTGLHAARAGLQVTSNNVSNMGAPGYTRQIIKQRATTPLDKYSGIGQVGTGTEVYGIGQIRDIYLDKKYWSQKSVEGEFKQKSLQLSVIEASLSSLSKTGLTNNVNDFFKSISDLSFSANDLNYRTSVINNANTLITNIQNHAHKLREQQVNLNDDAYSLVERINVIGSQLSDLNQQIYKFEIDGQTSNELRDQRALLIDELSKYVNVEVKETKDTTSRELGVKTTILINGQEFVNHNSSRKLTTVRRGDADALYPNDAPNLYNLVWEGGESLNLNGLQGELKGIIDIRDGGGTADNSYKGIPYYVNKLNEFVRTIAKAFNEGRRMDDSVIDGVIGHIDGFDLNGGTGNLFFTIKNADGTTEEDPLALDYDSIDVFNFSISNRLLENPSNLATSDTDTNIEESNNNVILGFLKLKDDVSIFREGGISQFINAVSSTLGIDASQAKSFSDYYKDIVSSVENQRMQVSGVSLNEEVGNMVKYQHLYQAASKLMNVINEIYNTTINGLGV